MSELRLDAQIREDFGKGASRRVRAAGRIPAVIYGHGTEPLHVTLPAHETGLALRVANAVIKLDVPGKDEIMVLAKDVQRHPFKPIIQHVDLMIVKKGEKVTVEVALNVVGDEKLEGVVVVDMQTLTLEVEATNIPEFIEHSVEGMEIGDQVFVSDLKLPAGATFVGDEEAIVIAINAPEPEVEEEETEGEEGADGEEAAEEAAEDGGDEE